MSKWISVDQQLPALKDNYAGGPRSSERVLVFNGHYVSVGEYSETFAKRIPRWASGYSPIVVTHWMPLPEPPK